MWNEIITEADAEKFVNRVYGFHDSCIKELNYVSEHTLQKILECIR